MFGKHFVFRLIRRFVFPTLALFGLFLIFYFVYVAHHNHVELERHMVEVQDFLSQDSSPSSLSKDTSNRRTEVRRTASEDGHAHHSHAGHEDHEHVYMVNSMPIESNLPLGQDSIELYEWIRTGKMTPAIEEQLRLHALDKKNVIQRVVAPDGKLHQVIVPRDSQYEEGDAILRSELDPPQLSPVSIELSTPVVTIKGVEYSVPDEYHALVDKYAREEYVHKFMWSIENGVSMADVEKKVAKGELDFSLSEDDKKYVDEQAVMMERSKMLTPEIPPLSDKPPVKVSFLPEDGENERPGWMQKQELNVWQSILAEEGKGSREIFDEERINQDASSAPVHPDVPRSPSDLSRVVESTPSDPNVANIEKQLTPQGTEAELSEGLSTDSFDKAQRLIDQYGAEEGLRRLREMDPEAARQFESVPRPGREQRNPPARDTSDEAASTQ